MDRAGSSVLTELDEEELVITGSAGDKADELTSTNRRRFPRITSLPEASVRLLGVPARLLDLGLGGAHVELAARLMPGSLTSVRLNACDVELKARVRIRRASVTGFVRTRGGETTLLYRGGLEFESLSPEDVRAVQAVLSGGPRAVGGKSAGRSPILASAPAVESTGQPGRLVSVRFPPGWAMTRKTSTVVASEPNARGFVFLRALPLTRSFDLCEFAQVSMREAGFSAMDSRPAVVNGLAACLGFYHGWMNGLGEVIAEAAHVMLEKQMYLIAGVASWTAYETMRHEFFTTIRSFEGQPRHDGVCLNFELKQQDPAPSEACEDGPDRRRHLRIAGPFDGRRVGMLETPVRVYDLSEGGCFISSLHETATDGQPLVLKIQLPREGWITVKAVTLYNRPGFGFAVRFTDVAEHVRTRLTAVLRNQQKQHEKLAQ